MSSPKKCTIYYFTGTGNSLRAAQVIAQTFGLRAFAYAVHAFEGDEEACGFTHAGQSFCVVDFLAALLRVVVRLADVFVVVADLRDVVVDDDLDAAFFVEVLRVDDVRRPRFEGPAARFSASRW